jgi:tetratricopeptide (TPR) repeat protein
MQAGTLPVLFMRSETANLPLSDRFWAWYDVNKAMALRLLAGIIVLTGVIATFLWWRGQKEEKASDALSSVALAQATGASRGEGADGYLKVANSYPGSNAGERALLLAAGGYFAEGKYDQARTQFERFRREYPSSPFMAEALLGIASCYDVQKKPNEAITAYKDIIDHHSTEVVVPQAKFSLASLYEAQNKFDQARSLFEDVARNGYSSVGSEAGMRLEELKASHPELFTNAVPASGMMPGLGARSAPMPPSKKK